MFREWLRLSRAAPFQSADQTGRTHLSRFQDYGIRGAYWIRTDTESCCVPVTGKCYCQLEAGSLKLKAGSWKTGY